MQTIQLVVNGTLMRGFDLNSNLKAAGATFIKETYTAEEYRLWSIEEKYPAMQRDPVEGKAITVEIWSIKVTELVKILLQEPPGLVFGRINLDDNSTVFGILGESWICKGQREITSWGGWREYINK
jgi:hypothetical protein